MARLNAFNLISIWVKKSSKCRRIIDKRNKDTSTYFAVVSIVCSVFIAVFGFLLSVGISTILNAQSNTTDGLEWRWITFGGIGTGLILAIIGGGSVLIICFHNIFNIYYQFRLNKRPISFIALISYIVSIIVVMVFVFISMG